MTKPKKPNSKYYRTKADNIFMARYRGLPCEICEKEEGTAFHHVVGKSRSKALRYEPKNGVILCQSCHTWSNEMAPHSVNGLAVERWHEWFKENCPGRYEWLKENEHIQRRFTYKQAVENLSEGLPAWE